MCRPLVPCSSERVLEPSPSLKSRNSRAFTPIPTLSDRPWFLPQGIFLAKPTPTLKQTLEALRRQVLVGKSYFNLSSPLNSPELNFGGQGLHFLAFGSS